MLWPLPLPLPLPQAANGAVGGAAILRAAGAWREIARQGPSFLFAASRAQQRLQAWLGMDRQLFQSDVLLHPAHAWGDTKRAQLLP
ncbi:hypothetical protein D3X12_21620 [Pseudomonas protegens]|nr:hypothetical protein CEP86_23275 [Pseudomonas protegens]QEZ53072.1 hypothetical protein D3X12_21620 [Pseudomonas protegens]QEZ60721.1 hypothetical protein D4N38_30185 [Pseudomonas protegens]QEZ64354.1 hypothetical protein D4N37_16950 [Pseudomonas protegens]